MRPERQRRAGGAGRVLGVVDAAQRADAADVGDGARAAAGRLHDLFCLDVKAVGQRAAH